eukprot:Hpha_TRINITY_DN13499_c0_g1::TRINITY_DN13499_c0_g1_i1::g.130773::m.130773
MELLSSDAPRRGSRAAEVGRRGSEGDVFFMEEPFDVPRLGCRDCTAAAEASPDQVALSPAPDPAAAPRALKPGDLARIVVLLPRDASVPARPGPRGTDETDTDRGFDLEASMDQL